MAKKKIAVPVLLTLTLIGLALLLSMCGGNKKQTAQTPTAPAKTEATETKLKPCEREHEVKSMEVLSRIIVGEYQENNEIVWQNLAVVNHDLLKNNPHRIFPHQKLVIPCTTQELSARANKIMVDNPTLLAAILTAPMFGKVPTTNVAKAKTPATVKAVEAPATKVVPVEAPATRTVETVVRDQNLPVQPAPVAPGNTPGVTVEQTDGQTFQLNQGGNITVIRIGPQQSTEPQPQVVPQSTVTPPPTPQSEPEQVVPGAPGRRQEDRQNESKTTTAVTTTVAAYVSQRASTQTSQAEVIQDQPIKPGLYGKTVKPGQIAGLSVGTIPAFLIIQESKKKVRREKIGVGVKKLDDGNFQLQVPVRKQLSANNSIVFLDLGDQEGMRIKGTSLAKWNVLRDSPNSIKNPTKKSYANLEKTAPKGTPFFSNLARNVLLPGGRLAILYYTKTNPVVIGLATVEFGVQKLVTRSTEHSNAERSAQETRAR